MAKSFNIISHERIRRLLGIARRHLDYIKRSRSKKNASWEAKCDHALVASVFSAAAIEAGLNLFISTPILFIKNEEIRRFFGILITKYSRIPVQQKIKFACEFCPELKNNEKLLVRVKKLFEYRNSVLHPSPSYAEPLGLPDEDKLPNKISEEDLIPYPELSLQVISSFEVEEAFQHYRTALDFLSKLNVYGQEPENDDPANNT